MKNRSENHERQSPRTRRIRNNPHLTKSYGAFRTLNDVSLDIKEEEIFGYIGSNGAGKTTTMKILVGLITDFQGLVSIGGHQVPKQKEEIHKLFRLSSPKHRFSGMAHRGSSAENIWETFRSKRNKSSRLHLRNSEHT